MGGAKAVDTFALAPEKGNDTFPCTNLRSASSLRMQQIWISDGGGVGKQGFGDMPRTKRPES